jgi:taurine dioxygenase
MARFGSRIREDGGSSDRWQTVGSNAVTPPQIISMRLGVIDAAPAEAWFTTAVGAYGDLSDSVRAVADRLWAVHASSGESDDNDGVEAATYEQAPPRSGIAHPVVRVHPETGERSLLVGAFARWLLDHSPEESRDVLHLLQAHVTADENLLRWRLIPGDVVLVDNRVIQSRVPRELEQPGSLRRVAVAGDAPLGVDGRHSYPLHKTEQRPGTWVAA